MLVYHINGQVCLLWGVLLFYNISYSFCLASPFQRQHQKFSDAERQLVYLNHPSDKASSKLSRNRRSAVESKIASKNSLPKLINYEFTAFNQNFNLNLTQDSSFIAPYVIVATSNDSRLDTAGDTLFVRGDLKRTAAECHYVATVNYKSLHLGHANICDWRGIRAAFITDGYEYLMEPAGEDNTSAHYLYKRSIVTADLSSNSQVIDKNHFTCATNTSDGILATLYKDMELTSWQSRSRRSVSREHTVELMIVADSHMLAYYGDGLEQYIFSLVAVASQIYKDGSLGNFVNLTLVKIRIITDPKDGPNITNNAQQALNSFCEWQHKENELDDSHPAHYDTAVMLTRVNICRSEGKCGTLGLAELGTVCNPERSCAIIEDNGLSSAFTIAHEIGHVFGLPHDDSDMCTRLQVSGDMAVRNSYNENQYHLMASTLDYNSQTWSWSACTRQSITKFLDMEDKTQCLRDKPPAVIDFQADIEPGQLYDKHKQCELVYGLGARICPYMPVCKRLWCTLPDNSGCRTQHMPWADGTDCGLNKWCQKGFCELKAMKASPIDGEWSAWSNWSECSRTCGGGVMYAERTCDNPSPESGGRFCLGKRRKDKSCNTLSCPAGQPGFRQKQCEVYNGRKFNRKELPANPQYEPHYSDVQSEQCKLYCSVKGVQPNYYKMSDKVIDGTKCTKTGLDVCVEGRCKSAGCDNTLYSGLTYDICGVCGGDNSTCRMTNVVDEAYTRQVMTYGYNRVTVLPINASSIEITQGVGHIDENYLAIKDSKDTYLFNGNYIVMMYSLEVELSNGARVQFSGSEQVVEKINVHGFIAEELTVEVLSVGSLQPANVHYKYVLPIEGKVSFHWAINSSWTECNSECRGKRSERMFCLREQDNLHVNERHCESKPRPAVKQEWCNLQCDIRWKIENMEECSVKCGRGFIKRKVTCIKQSLSGVEQVANDKCPNPKPSSIEACTGRCSPTMWRFSTWSPCTASCGGGTQMRDAVCTLRNGRKIDDFACNKQEKLVSRLCNTQDCTMYELGDWSQCSVSCGLGSRSRTVVCMSGTGLVDLSACGSSPPPATQPCQRGACPSWHVSEWTDCSATCSTGFKYREVTCQQGANAKVIDDEYCPEETRPIEVHNCTMDACPGWVPSNWSDCTVTCGGNGVRRRSVECKDSRGNIAAVSLCQMNLRPEDTSSCTAKSSCSQNLQRGFSVLDQQNKKKYVWRFGGWTACSVSCGEGFRRRIVKCTVLSDPDMEVADAFCRKQSKPDDEQGCKMAYCGVWRNGTWSQCSSSCGDGSQFRVVVCRLHSGDYGAPSDCDLENMPVTRRSCSLMDCPIVVTNSPITTITTPHTAVEPVKEVPSTYWRTGPWTECSKSCEGGWRRRAIECYFEYSKSTGCDIVTQPVRMEKCNTQACPTWRMGGWTECSSLCGYGSQERMVVCQLANGTTGDGSLCVGTSPAHKKTCMLRPCGTPTWNSTAWSQCSASCGVGKRTREIACVDSTNTSLVLHTDLCSSDTKPSRVDTCALKECSKWYYSDWGQCGGLCNTSTQQREVWCGTSSTNRMPEVECEGVNKPPLSKICIQDKCNFQWHLSDWSKCTAGCGEGTQRRDMVCKATNGTDVAAVNCAPWPPPLRSRKCNNGQCPEWKVLPWDQCSVTCGYGQQKRLIECFNRTSNKVVADDLCNNNKKPVQLTMCQADPCPVWKSYAWGKCSGPCNVSTTIQRRSVLCLSTVTQKELDVSACDKSAQPDVTRPCQDCSRWQAEEWSRCSETCGVGIQARRLQCISSKGVTVADDDCSNEVRPKLIRSCQQPACTHWHTQNWSKCSVSCKEGQRSRAVACVNSHNMEPVEDRLCHVRFKPSTQESCTVLAQCPTWSTSQWSQCAVSCGDGMKHRNISCPIPDSCDPKHKPLSTAACKMPACHSGFEWKAEKWSECSTTCGYGVKARAIKCHSLKSNKPVPLYFCPLHDKPTKQRRCQEKHCPFTWWADKWSQCSATCGEGRQFRKVLCKSKSSEGWYTGNSGFGCAITEKPAAITSCTMGPCYASYIWQPEPWGKCSAECGWGNERRRLSCISTAGEKMPRSKCNAMFKPERSRKCYAGPCKSASCSELRRKSSIREDGDYYLFVGGSHTPTKVYCHRMYAKEPVEYISLVSGPNENYALVYGYRLAHPYSCPYASNKVESSSCANCVTTPYSRAGETRFSKVRLNITSLTIIANDFQFSKTNGKKQVEFGSAGDCYSALDCPQGRFSVNLTDTGFRVAPDVQWLLDGAYTYKDIVHLNDGLVVQGKCGGYCGLCSPAQAYGLQLELVDSE